MSFMERAGPTASGVADRGRGPPQHSALLEGWARAVEAGGQSARVQCWPTRSRPKLWCGSVVTSSKPARS